MRLSIALAALGLALIVLPALVGASSPRQPPTLTVDMAQVGYGQALFSAKGCAHCHRHGAVAGAGIFSEAYGSGAPDLTDRPLTADFLRVWLKDPAAIRPGTLMPNLGLKSEEIEALTAFLLAGEGKP